MQLGRLTFGLVWAKQFHQIVKYDMHFYVAYVVDYLFYKGTEATQFQRLAYCQVLFSGCPVISQDHETPNLSLQFTARDRIRLTGTYSTASVSFIRQGWVGLTVM